MRLWRVSDYETLDGRGGELVGGRWNKLGRPVVYTAEHSALALLETLARLEFDETVPPYRLLEIAGPDDLTIMSYPERSAPSDQLVSAAWGEQWLADGLTLLAKVPSVLAPHANNFLINPRHSAAASLKILSHDQYDWDLRLVL